MATTTLAPELEPSYEHCRRMHRRFDPTYYWATRRLPADVRPGVHALYAFVRTADEIVDGPGRLPSAAARRAALDGCQRDLEHALAGHPSHDPTVAALVDTAGRHELDLGGLDAYFESMRLDCGSVRMESWDELERYMLGSAGSVGGILAALLDVSPERRDSFVRLALAFQLTNFIRDVRQDWGLDRIYLPAEELERLGFRDTLALQVGRARELFRESRPAADVVSPGVRRGMLIARSVYGALLDRAEQVNFDVLRHRTELPPWRLAEAVAQGLRA